ncbi:MAG: type II toxin-antitoxin system VapC family toxin [Bifidobacteriaceae bacterium]|jgi:ribonuclease VapC|nr:type II toxin-antitoxin system VapC family toxin [Bifidobacteriaceae bacterium]
MGIVADTSVLAAVVLGEDDAEALAGVLLQEAGDVHVGAATFLEAGIVLHSRQGEAAVADLRLLLNSIGARTVPFDEEQAELALAAWRRFGKGRHPAALNYGDCMAYALSKRLGLPLLYKGEDFGLTDVSARAVS